MLRVTIGIVIKSILLRCWKKSLPFSFFCEQQEIFTHIPKLFNIRWAATPQVTDDRQLHPYVWFKTSVWFCFVSFYQRWNSLRKLGQGSFDLRWLQQNADRMFNSHLALAFLADCQWRMSKDPWGISSKISYSCTLWSEKFFLRSMYILSLASTVSWSPSPSFISYLSLLGVCFYYLLARHGHLQNTAKGGGEKRNNTNNVMWLRL